MLNAYRTRAPGRRKIARASLLAVAASALLACPSGPRPIPEPTGPDPSLTRVFTDAIRTGEVFLKYSRVVAGERFTKFLIDVKTDAMIFIDVNVYAMHQDFVCQEVWHTKQTPGVLARFLENYEEDKPDFILGYVVHHLDQDVWTFAFSEGDRLRPAHVEKAYSRLRETFFVTDALHFRPDAHHHEAVADEVKGVPVMTNDAIYKRSTYQVFNRGSTIGRLRIVRFEGDGADVVYHPEEVVVLTETVNTISVVAGIISEQFSGPLSHASLRARAWGIPHIGLKNAAEQYAALNGKMVLLEASAEGYTLREATAAELEAYDNRTHRRKNVVIPRANLQEKALRRLVHMRASMGAAYGAKAANLGEIARAHLKGFEVPPGFGLPIHYYHEHMERSGLAKQVEALLREERILTDGQYRKTKLAELRAAIRQAPLDPHVLGAVMANIAAIHGHAGKGVFVRSSTNAEDLPGFSGAGLYDTVPNVLGQDHIAKAIKHVWSSVWNMRAFDERNFYGIDHRGVFGAVLIQVGVNATAAGVLVTANTFDPSDRTTFTINAKSGLGMRVVEGKKIPEHLLYKPSDRSIKVISRSDEDSMLVFDKAGGVREVANPRKGDPVLTDARAYTLGDAVVAIQRLFPAVEALDVEWLFVGDTLHIVQARPYVTR